MHFVCGAFSEGELDLMEKHRKIFLKIESTVIVLFSLAAFFYLGGKWWLLILGFIAIDLSMIGYLFGNKIGAGVYNLFHIYGWGLAVVFVGFIADYSLLMQFGIVWVFHIGLDRTLGFGLKPEKGFKEIVNV